MKYKNDSLNKNGRHSLCLLFLFVVSVFTSAAQNTNDTSIRNGIRLLNRRLEEAFNSNDMPKVASFYADDAEIVYDNGPTVKGRAALDNYWLSLKYKGRGWGLTVIEVGGGGEFVFQLGKSDLKHMSGTMEARSITNFVLLWRKQADGSYKIFKDYLVKTGFEKK